MRKRSIAATTALLVSIGSLAPTTAHAAEATTIYVNNAQGSNCSDSVSGAGTAPYCTVQAAADAAGAGQTVVVEPGTYGQNLTVTHGGTAGAPLTIESAQPQQAQLGYNKGSITVAAATAPAISVSGTSYVTVRGFTTIGMSGAAAVVDNASNVVIDNLQTGLYSTGLASLPVIEVSGSSSDVTVSRNILSESGYPALVKVDASGTGNIVTTNYLSGDDSGVVVDGTAGTAVTSNTIQYICNQGVLLTGASTGSTIENNVIDTVSSNAVSSDCATTTSAVTGIEVDSTATSGTKLDYNIVDPVYVPGNAYTWSGAPYQTADELDGTTGQGAHDINDQPDAYPLPATDSPAIDSADSGAPGELSTDLVGNARVDDPKVADSGAGTATYDDRGAYELEDPLAPVVGLDTEVGTAPATFTATESGGDTGWAPVTSWTVDFGDGSGAKTTSTPQQISHSYTKAGQYTVTVTATDGLGSDGRGSTSTTEQVWVLNSSVFHPVNLSRILDTRKGTGTGGIVGPVTMNTGIPLGIDGVDGIPASGVTAVALNVTVAGPTGNGYIEAYADGTARPTTSNMNYTKGENLATQVIAPVGADGKIELYNGMTGGATDLIADVVGYFGTGAGLGAGIDGSPTRILDTRHGIGTDGKKVPVPAGGTLKITPASTDGFIGYGETDIFNVTVVDEKSNGFLTVYPDGGTRPGTSNINFRTGQTIANQVFVQSGGDGAIDFYNAGSGSVDVIADVLGAFYNSNPTGYVPITPTRVLDTRKGTGAPVGAVRAGATITASYSAANLGPDGEGVAATVTVVSPTGSGDIEAYPSYMLNAPGVSTLNFTAGATVANSTTMGIEGDGLKLYNQSAGSSQLLLDVFGYYQDYRAM